MDAISYKTVSENKSTVKKDWVVVNVDGLVLGRISSEIAKVLRGKHKPGFTPHVDGGDHVIVLNAEKVRLTGKKWSEKEYVSYTGYPGGQRFSTPRRMLDKHPERVIEYAVEGMLQGNKLGAALFRNLHVYAGSEHPHAAQTPTEVKL